MILFLLTFFLVYGCLHLYVFLKVRASLTLGTETSVFLVLFMIVMVVAPVIIRLSEKAGLELLARLFAYIGYMWMGILILFVSGSLIIDMYRFILFASGIILKKDLSLITVPHTYALFIPLVISIMVALYGSFEARDIRTERVMIKTQKISKEIGSLKIVQISDVHLGLIVREERLKKILHIVKTEKPDILVSTGDLVDGQSDNLTRIADLLNEIKPRYGKFAITGNHEFYAGLTHSLQFMEKSGFTILRGEKLSVVGMINIVGVDDPAGKRYNLYNNISEIKLLTGLRQNTFTLLLKHRPVVDDSSVGLFDLQLSGHVHKGQIFPLSIITGLLYPTQEGLANLPSKSHLYVSRGSGTWGPPIRFLSPPEVTVIELVHSQDFK